MDYPNNVNYPDERTTLGLLFKFKEMMIDHFNQADYDPNKDEELMQLAKEGKVSFLIVKADGIVMYGVRGGS